MGLEDELGGGLVHELKVFSSLGRHLEVLSGTNVVSELLSLFFLWELTITN